uniref:Uncharacterized protein n=1 Tax=mine drainage metagenome TaxID=410659 RepID=E6PCL3_9ZZZZ
MWPGPTKIDCPAESYDTKAWLTFWLLASEGGGAEADTSAACDALPGSAFPPITAGSPFAV